MSIQSRPIEMRDQIMYLAIRWTKFKMLLTPNRFLDLIRFLLISFPLIPQFIAHFDQFVYFYAVIFFYSLLHRNKSSC